MQQTISAKEPIVLPEWNAGLSKLTSNADMDVDGPSDTSFAFPTLLSLSAIAAGQSLSRVPVDAFVHDFRNVRRNVCSSLISELLLFRSQPICMLKCCRT